MRSWAVGKTIGMCLAILIGIALCLDLFINGGPGEKSAAISLLFIPYMIRRLFRSTFGILNGGQAKELLELFLVLILSLTFVYPIFKLIQEIILYSRIFNATKKPKNKTDRVLRAASEHTDNNAIEDRSDSEQEKANEIIPQKETVPFEPKSTDTVIQHQETTPAKNEAAPKTNSYKPATPSYSTLRNSHNTVENYNSRRVYTSPTGKRINIYKNTDKISADEDYTTDKYVDEEEVSPLTLFYREQERKESAIRAYYQLTDSSDITSDSADASNKPESSLDKSPVSVNAANTNTPQQVYYNAYVRERRNQISHQAIRAKVIDKTHNKTIYVQDTKYRPSEVMFSVINEETFLIKQETDGFWYLNGAVSCHFDLYLNGVKKPGSYTHKLNSGDTIKLCGEKTKSRSEYIGKTFEYQFFIV